MADKGSKTSKSKSLSDELLKDDFFKPPVDEIMEEDVAGEAAEEVQSVDEVLDEADALAEGEKPAPSQGVPVKYLIIGGGGLLVIGVVIVVYFLLFSGPKIKPAPVIQPGGPAPVVQAPAQPAAPAPAAPQVKPPSAPAPTPAPTPAPAAPPAAAPEPSQPAPAEKPATPPAAQPEPEKKPVQVAAVPRFTLSLGTYADEAELKASLAKLKGLGLNPISEEKTITTAKYFIFLNEKLTPGQAKANSLKLKMLQKIENEIIPQADGTAKVRVGPLADKKQATEMKGKMDGAGFPSEIRAEESKAQGYSLKAGKFATREEANKTISTLKQKGLKAEIVSLE